MMKKILLTGGTGFVGSYFLKNYSESFQVCSYSLSKSGIEGIKNSFDSVIHLSAIVHQKKTIPTEIYERVNVENTLELARKVKKEGCRHFVFLSSVKVYGEESELPYNESSVCLPLDDYGKSKLKAEEQLRLLEDDNFKVSIIRSPLVYGPRAKANMKSLLGLVQWLPIIPLGGIKNKRSIVFVGNLCHLINVLVLEPKSGIFLAADDNFISTSELIKKLALYSERKVKLIPSLLVAEVLKLFLPGFYRRLFLDLYLDNSETVRKLHYKNPFSTDEGIKLMVESFKN